MDMNRIQSQSMGWVVLLLVLAASAAKAGEKNLCWVDLFEHPQYQGQHLLVEGPAQLENLNNVNGENWDRRIDSIKVGPKAKVTVYQNPKFKLNLTEMAKSPDLMRGWGITEKDILEDSELIFNENAKIHELGDFNFNKKTRSLKIECQ
jgi:hypothetical protein